MNNKIFKYENDWASIRLVDSFVKKNKAGSGNGEACLYLGSQNNLDLFTFFGIEDFDVHCIILRDDIIDYLESVKWEYIYHRFHYRNEVSVKTWQSNLDEIKTLPEELDFNLKRKRQNDISGRVYAHEPSYKRACGLTYYTSPKAYTYNLIRTIVIPEVSYLMLTKTTIDSELFAKLYYDPKTGY